MEFAALGAQPYTDLLYAAHVANLAASRMAGIRYIFAATDGSQQLTGAATDGRPTS